jgi:hypothetical protein
LLDHIAAAATTAVSRREINVKLAHRSDKPEFLWHGAVGAEPQLRVVPSRLADRMTSVAVKIGDGEFEYGAPASLFKTRMVNLTTKLGKYDVTADGKHFLIGTTVGRAEGYSCDGDPQLERGSEEITRDRC